MSLKSGTGLGLAAALLVGCSSGVADPTSTAPSRSVQFSTAPSAGTSASLSVTDTAPGTPAQTSTAPTTASVSPTSTEPPTTTSVRPTEPAAADLTTGLAAPWSITFVDDVAVVSERDSGRILEVDPATGATREIGVVDGVTHGGEGGVLGLTVDQQRRLYVYSTGAEGNRVQRFPLDGATGSLTLGPGETVLEAIPSAGTHNGGRIAIGPDGLLYVATGDAGNRDAAQDVASLAGKILRITLDGGAPADNPFPGSPVWSLGHRNVQGLAWSADGTMYAAEFGQNTWDELNVIIPGANYGWPEVEGIGGVEGFVDPIRAWATDDASPSGIAVDGDRVLIANLKGTSLRSVPIADPAAEQVWFDDRFGRLRDVVVAPDGRLWVLTNNTDGRGDPTDGDDRILLVEVP